MRLHLAPALLAAGVLLGLVVPQLGVVDDPWGTSCGLAWCADRPAPAPVDQLAELGELAERSRDGCVRAGAWPAGQLPSEVVVRRVDGRVDRVGYRQAWALAQAGRAWVVLLCP